MSLNVFTDFTLEYICLTFVKYCSSDCLSNVNDIILQAFTWQIGFCFYKMCLGKHDLSIVTVVRLLYQNFLFHTFALLSKFILNHSCTEMIRKNIFLGLNLGKSLITCVNICIGTKSGQSYRAVNDYAVFWLYFSGLLDLSHSDWIVLNVMGT